MWYIFLIDDTLRQLVEWRYGKISNFSKHISAPFFNLCFSLSNDWKQALRTDDLTNTLNWFLHMVDIWSRFLSIPKSRRSVNVVFIQSDFTFEFLIGLKTLTTNEDSDFVNKLCNTTENYHILYLWLIHYHLYNYVEFYSSVVLGSTPKSLFFSWNEIWF